MSIIRNTCKDRKRTVHLASPAGTDITFSYLLKNGRQAVIGHGQFGQMYSAWDYNGHRCIAVKHEKLKPDALSILTTECLVPTDLNHQNIVRYIGYSWDDGCLKVFMELLIGGTLADLVRGEPVLDYHGRLRNYTTQLLTALKYLADNDVVHGDLCGQHVFIAHHNSCILKLADFGLSRRLQQYRETPFNEQVYYMPPEMVKERKLSHQADIWALGCTVIEMVEGEGPRTQGNRGTPDDEDVCSDVTAPLVPHGIPEDIRVFLEGCFELSEETRPSAECLLQRSPYIKGSEGRENDYFVQHRPHFLYPRSLSEGAWVHKDMTHSTAKSNGKSQCVGRRASALRASKKGQMERLAKGIFKSQDKQTLIPWMHSLWEELLHPALSDPQWLRLMLDIEERLWCTLQQYDATDMVGLEALSLYTAAVCSLYAAVILGTMEMEAISEILVQGGKIRELLTNAKDKAIDRTPEQRYMLEITSRLLSYLIQEPNWTKVAKPSFLQKSKATETRKTFEDVVEFCSSEDECTTQQRYTGKLTGRVMGIGSWFERALILFYVGLKGIDNPCGVVLYKCLVQRYIGECMDLWLAVCITKIFVWMLEKAENLDDCVQVIDGNDQKTEMGLRGFLVHLTGFGSLHRAAMATCLPLLYHDFDITRDLLCNNALEDWISETTFHRRLLENLFLRFDLNLKKQVQSSQCGTLQIIQGTINQNQPVTLRLLRPRKRANQSFAKMALDQMRRFQQQLQSLLHLSQWKLPNIIRLLAFQNSGTPNCFLVECLPTTQPLDEFLIKRRERHPRIDLETLLSLVVLPVIKAVQFCHDRDVVLRDLTAASFQVSETGSDLVLKLTSFGMACILTSSIKKEQIYCGSRDEPIPLLWNAPESLVSSVFSVASDCYMLGHTLLQILTMGCRPYYYEQELPDEHVIIQVLFHGKLPKQPECLPRSLYHNLLGCFVTTATRRKQTSRILEDVEGFFHKKRNHQPHPVKPQYDPPALPEKQRKMTLGIPEKLIAILDILHGMTHGSDEVVLSDIFGSPELPRHYGPHSDTEFHIPPPDSPVVTSQDTDMYKVPLYSKLELGHVRKLGALQHPNLAAVGMMDENRGLYYLNMTAQHDVTLSDYVIGLNCLTQRLEDTLQPLLSHVTQGMAYLHDNGILHCNLQAKYVHVSLEPLQARIGHFGRSQVTKLGFYETKFKDVVVTPSFHEDQNYTSSAARWQPPEVNIYGLYSQSSDVGAFGLMCHELGHLYGAQIDGCPHKRPRYYPYADVPCQEIARVQGARQPLPHPAGCPEWFHVLAKVCLLQPDFRRPDFSEITECLLSGNPEEHSLVRPFLQETSRDAEQSRDDIFADDDRFFWEVTAQPLELSEYDHKIFSERVKKIQINLNRELKKHFPDTELATRCGGLLRNKTLKRGTHIAKGNLELHGSSDDENGYATIDDVRGILSTKCHVSETYVLEETDVSPATPRDIKLYDGQMIENEDEPTYVSGLRYVNCPDQTDFAKLAQPPNMPTLLEEESESCAKPRVPKRHGATRSLHADASSRVHMYKNLPLEECRPPESVNLNTPIQDRTPPRLPAKLDNHGTQDTCSIKEYHYVTVEPRSVLQGGISYDAKHDRPVPKPRKPPPPP